MPATIEGCTLEAIRAAHTCQDAVAWFFDRISSFLPQLNRTIRNAEAVYRFETPDRPVFQFDVTGMKYRKSRWVRGPLERGLDHDLQRILYQLESLPESDYVPLLNPGWGHSDLLPRMFGAEIERLPDGGGTRTTTYLIRDLEKDMQDLIDPDPSRTPDGRGILERVRFLIDATGGRIPICYPQMQGPVGNIVRIMPQEDVLMATVESPDLIRELALRIWRVAIQFTKDLWNATGGPKHWRPRMRGPQPDWIKGVIVEDYISVMRPETFLEITHEACSRMQKEVGPYFWHTCGPVMLAADVLKRLPGLAGFETAFVERFSKTTDDLARMKAELSGKVVLQSFELPHGETVHDEENLTADWLRAMSKGGGFIMQVSGTAEEGRRLFEKLELA